MASAPYGVETLRKISIVWVGRTNVTDDSRQTTDDRRQTDRRQTDRRWHIANMNLSSRSLKSNCNICSFLHHRVVNVIKKLPVKISDFSSAVMLKRRINKVNFTNFQAPRRGREWTKCDRQWKKQARHCVRQPSRKPSWSDRPVHYPASKNRSGLQPVQSIAALKFNNINRSTDISQYSSFDMAVSVE